MEKIIKGTIILEAKDVQEATTLVQEYEAKDFELIGTPGDFNGKILITMKKIEKEKLNKMMNDMMSGFKKKGI